MNICSVDIHAMQHEMVRSKDVVRLKDVVQSKDVVRSKDVLLCWYVYCL